MSEVHIECLRIVHKWVGGLVGGRVGDINATSGLQLTTDVQFNSVELVILGQMWQL